MLSISVDYYNNKELELFKSYPNYNSINNLIQGNFTIKKSEFLTYLMFTEQDNADGWRSYNELKERFQSRFADIEDILDFNDGNLKTNFSAERLNNMGMTERLGVSLGLNVVNTIHNLSEADWYITKNIYINGKRRKDFDYELPIDVASDGQKYIQVENKGSVCDDNNYKCSSVSQHYKSIKEKKKDILGNKIDKVSERKNIHYGTIGVLDTRNTAKVWLVDPIAFEIDWNPIKYKLVSRLLFYAELFNQVGVHKRIISSLVERIELIIKTSNFEKLNNIRLDRIEKIPRTYLLTKNFVKINTNEAFGTFFFIKNKKEGVNILLLAVTKQIIKLIINQDFDAILEYNYKNEDLSKKTIVELSSTFSQYNEESEYDKLKFVFDEKRKRYFTQYYGEINYTSSGRIFGIIK